MTRVERNEEAPEIQTQGLSQGVWGKRSKREIVAAGSLICVAVVALIVVIAVLAGGDDDGGSGEPAREIYQRPVEPVVVINSKDQELTLLRETLDKYEATKGFLDTIPSDVASLAGTGELAAAEVRAAAWLINEDPINDERNLSRRFALAYIYYNNGGEGWTRTNYWMTEKSHCEWEGVTCAGDPGLMAMRHSMTLPNHAVYELELMNNNLTGEIPSSLVLLQGLQALFLNGNKLEGPLHDVAFRALPNLLKLYLQHNVLTGDIPSTLADNGVIDTAQLQANKLSGAWPANLCKSCPTCTDAPLPYFGIDCDLVVCPPTCCGRLYQCFSNKDIQ